jgi:PAS domain S-box-containing protein
VNLLSIHPDLAQALIVRAAQENVSVETLLARWLQLDGVPPQVNLSLQHESLLQQVSDAVIATDRQLTITAWNRAAEVIYGWITAEALGQPIDRLLKTDWVSETQAQAAATLTEKGSWQGEVRQQTKEGRTCDIWASVSWIKDDQGQIVGGITVNRDVTEQKRTDIAYKQLAMELSASAEQYRLIAENTSDGILIFDAAAQITYASPAYDKQLGRPEGSTVKLDEKHIYERLHPEDRDVVFGDIYKAIDQKRDTLIYAYRTRHNDGYYTWREDHAKFKYDDHGVLFKTYVISRDITERKQAEEAMHRQNAYLTVLHQITLDLLNHQNTPELLQSIVDHAAVILDAPHVELVFAEGDELVVQSCTNNQSYLIGDRTKRGEACLSWQAYDTGQVVTTADYSIEPNHRAVYDRFGLRAVASIPIMVNQVCQGVIDLGRTTPSYPFTPEQIQQGVLFAQLVALLLENTRLHEAAAREIDQRKQIEESLRSSETHLRSLVDLQTAYVVRTDLNGQYTYINDAFFNKFRWMVANNNEFIGMSSLQTIVPADHQLTLETTTACIQQPGVSVQVILRKPTQNGGLLQTLWEFVALTDDSGAASEIQCIGIDVTELMAARQQLQLQQRALESSANVIVITDQNGIIQWVNPAFTTLTGYSSDDIIGKTPRIMKSGVQDRAFYKTLWDTIRAGEVWHGQLVNKRKNGSFYTEEQTITPVYDDQGKTISHFVSIKQDVTEREQAQRIQLEQERLKASLRKEQEFNALIQKAVSALSHDVRTPMAVIAAAKASLDFYFDRLDEQKRRDKLESIGRQIRYMVELLDNVVMTVKGNLDHTVFKPELVNLAALCQVCVAEIQETTGKKHHLAFVTDGQITTAIVDETLVNRILLNLLTNAVKFSPEASEIRLTLSGQADSVVLCVTDQGMGISAVDLPRIFDPFYRTQSAQYIRGTGLGLNIVKDCVDNHQGQITVESQVGKGTTFTITLPLKLSNANPKLATA